jgi:hypothetical protein
VSDIFSGSKEIWIFWTGLCLSFEPKISRKAFQWKTDGRADMTKLKGAFRDCANPPKKVVIANLADIMATLFGRTPVADSLTAHWHVFFHIDSLTFCG